LVHRLRLYHAIISALFALNGKFVIERRSQCCVILSLSFVKRKTRI